MAPYIALALIFCGAALTLATALTGRKRERDLTRRVDWVTAASQHATQVRRRLPLSDGFNRLGHLVTACFTFRMRRTWGISISALPLLLIGLAAAVAVTLLCRTVLHLPLYLVVSAALGGFFLVPRFLALRDQRKADAAFAELLPDAVDMVVRMVRAGLPVGAAMRAVGDESDRPLSTIFASVADLAELGVPLPDALADMGESVGNADFRFFGVAVALQQSTGGNLALTLETLSEIVRKRRAVRLKAWAATAEIRMSAIVLAAIPFFVVGALLVVAPGYLAPLINDPRGNVIIGSALFGLGAAIVSMRAMLRAAMAH